MTVKLGSEQEGLLCALVEHGSWYGDGFGCGWAWGTPSQTERILRTLENRKLVTKADEPVLYRKRNATVWRATETGEAYVLALKHARHTARTGEAP